MTTTTASSALPDRITGLNESLILQVAARAMAREDSIRLYAGESDEPTPACIVEAANESMRRGETRYVLSRGIDPLRQAIARYLQRSYAVDINADRVTVTVGGMQAISQSLLAVLEPGDDILVPVPTWPNILEATQVAGANPVPVAMGYHSATGWHLDLDELIANIGPKTRAIFINSPSNPTGWTMPAADVQALMQLARERGLWIIADEVYGRLVYPQGDVDQSATTPSIAPSFLSVSEPEDRLIITNTMSKNWSMTGWRVGWVVAPPSMGLIYDNLMQYGSTGATTFAQHAAAVALDQGDTQIEQMVAQCSQSRQIICDALGKVPGIRFAKPQGAFYLFFGVDGLQDSRQLAFDILDATGVAMAPGAAFHASGEGWMRLCFGVSQPTLRDAADRLVNYFNR